MKQSYFVTRGILSVVLTMCVPACDQEAEDRGGEIDDSDLDHDNLGFRGVTTYNGLDLGNGLTFSNGLALSNGLSLSNGLAFSNGLAISNGLAYSNGLSATSGFVTSTAGRKFLKYLVECALPEEDSIVKGSYTFTGKVGLAPEWKYNQCGSNCQRWVSACLLARVNEFGVTVKIDMRGNNSALGIGSGGAEFTEQEGAFFGNLFVNPPRAYACRGRNSNNAYYSNRTCTLGRCAMREVDYAYCSNGCTWYSGGTMSNCWASNNPYSYEYDDNYTATITTYLKPYWQN